MPGSDPRTELRPRNKALFLNKKALFLGAPHEQNYDPGIKLFFEKKELYSWERPTNRITTQNKTLFLTKRALFPGAPHSWLLLAHLVAFPV